MPGTGIGAAPGVPGCQLSRRSEVSSGPLLALDQSSKAVRALSALSCGADLSHTPSSKPCPITGGLLKATLLVPAMQLAWPVCCLAWNWPGQSSGKGRGDPQPFLSNHLIQIPQYTFFSLLPTFSPLIILSCSYPFSLENPICGTQRAVRCVCLDVLLDGLSVSPRTGTCLPSRLRTGTTGQAGHTWLPASFVPKT